MHVLTASAMPASEPLRRSRWTTGLCATVCERRYRGSANACRRPVLRQCRSRPPEWPVEAVVRSAMRCRKQPGHAQHGKQGAELQWHVGEAPGLGDQQAAGLQIGENPGQHGRGSSTRCSTLKAQIASNGPPSRALPASATTKLRLSPAGFAIAIISGGQPNCCSAERAEEFHYMREQGLISTSLCTRCDYIRLRR